MLQKVQVVEHHHLLELAQSRYKSLSDTEKIADYLIAGSSVVLNIEEIPSDDVIRFMDYLHGVLHVIHGNMKQVSKTTFVATPNNVGIDSEEGLTD